MEKRVIHRDRQEVQAVDFNNIGEFAKTAIDHVVKDGIQDAKGWTEFQVIESGTAEITVEPGRIYNAGAVYVVETDTVFDLLSNLPAVNKKWVAVVAWGSEADVDTQPRDFLIDATTGATEPAAVAMQRLRKANIATVVGIEAPQPAKPAIDSGNVIIAIATALATTGPGRFSLDNALGIRVPKGLVALATVAVAVTVINAVSDANYSVRLLSADAEVYE